MGFVLIATEKIEFVLCFSESNDLISTNPVIVDYGKIHISLSRKQVFVFFEMFQCYENGVQSRKKSFCL